MGQAPGVRDPEPSPIFAVMKMGQAPGVHAPEPVPFSLAKTIATFEMVVRGWGI
jgi:hypothetical protein